MTDEAREAKNAYRREYYRKNKEKFKQWDENHWERLAQRVKEKESAGIKESEVQDNA